MYSIIDTHAHLEDIAELEQAIAEAKAAGVSAIIAVGSDVVSNEKALEIAAKYPAYVYPAIGYHPSNIQAAEIERNLAFIEANISRAAAVGEVGLDYHKRVRAQTEKDVQQGVFRDILSIACKHNKPVSVHSRYAWQDSLTLVEQSGVKPAVFHWYTGTSSVLRGIVERGYYISATPAVEYHEEHRRAVKEAPLNRLLLETDSPVTYGRGSPGEFEARPAHLVRTLAGAARVRGMSEGELAEITTRNARELFRLG